MHPAGSDRAQGAFPLHAAENPAAFRAATTHCKMFSCHRNVFFQRGTNLDGNSLYSNAAAEIRCHTSKARSTSPDSWSQCTFPGSLPTNAEHYHVIYLVFTICPHESTFSEQSQLISLALLAQVSLPEPRCLLNTKNDLLMALWG